jgi:hypothetical protein
MSNNKNVDNTAMAAAVESPVGKTGLFFKYHNNNVFFKNKSKYTTISFTRCYVSTATTIYLEK